MALLKDTIINGNLNISNSLSINGILVDPLLPNEKIAENLTADKNHKIVTAKQVKEYIESVKGVGESKITPSTSSSFTPAIVKNSTTNVSGGAITTSKPANGYYVSVKSNSQTAKTIEASTTISTAGWFPKNYNFKSKTINIGLNSSSDYYIPINTATFKTETNKVITSSEGYIGKNVEVGSISKTSRVPGSTTLTSVYLTDSKTNYAVKAYGTVSTGTGYIESGSDYGPNQSTEATKYIIAGSISSGSVDHTEYSQNTTAVPSGGYLYIGEGYYPNTQISLSSLIPDDNLGSDKIDVGYIRSGYKAFNTEGIRIVGTMQDANISNTYYTTTNTGYGTITGYTYNNSATKYIIAGNTERGIKNSEYSDISNNIVNNMKYDGTDYINITHGWQNNKQISFSKLTQGNLGEGSAVGKSYELPSGKTVYVNGKKIVGEAPYRSTTTPANVNLLITEQNGETTIPWGFYYNTFKVTARLPDAINKNGYIIKGGSGYIEESKHVYHLEYDESDSNNKCVDFIFE